jgi:hypothetical protein
MRKILLTVFLLPFLCNAQEKKDSTMLRFWTNEFLNAQRQMKVADTLKIKWTGIAENAFYRAIEEQRKLQPEKEGK